MEDDTDSRPRAIRIQLSDPSLLLVPICASSFGFVSGLLTAAQRSSLQFLAENAHRQPTTLQGWYFYNKTKNYRVALAGAKGGLATAARLGAWTTGYVLAKEAGRSIVGLKDYQAGALGGSAVAVAASVLYRLPRKTLGKRILLGLAFGTLAGGLQDARDWIHQQRLKSEARQTS